MLEEVYRGYRIKITKDQALWQAKVIHIVSGRVAPITSTTPDGDQACLCDAQRAVDRYRSFLGLDESV